MKPIDEKIAAFVKRYLKTAPPEEMKAACERNLQRLLAKVEAMERARDKAQAEPIEKLPRLDQLVLTAAYLLRGEGDTLAVWEKVNEMLQKESNAGAFYVAVERLGRQGLLQARLSDPVPERGGIPRKFLIVTAKGERALAHARENEAPAPGFLQKWI